MRRTITRTVSYKTLQRRGGSAATVVKLMIACNDMQVANQGLSFWKEKRSIQSSDQNLGACLYFIRLQISHLYEAMKIFQKIQKDGNLISIIESCDSQTRKSYCDLSEFLSDGKNKQWLEKMTGQLRHNLVFHYDENGKMVEKAIADRASRDEASSITRGSTAHLWHFKPGDEIVDSVVVRQIWGVSREANVADEIDRIVGKIHKIFLMFVDFSGDFIWRYCAK